jgi:hypothetical protein
MEPKSNEIITDVGPAPQNVDEQSTVVDPTDQTDPNTNPDGQPIGADNIREGRVGGVMGGPNQQQGEGQGG